jgi:scyllo-inositol 2-dehydrogenase (NADP+)
MTSPIRVAIAGCGAIARHAHVPGWLANRDARIVALCDPDRDAMRVITERHRLDCATYGSLDELLSGSRGEVDVVDICTPGHMHLDHARRALQAGHHVLLEKPPVPSAADAQELIDLARSRDLKLGAIFNYRYRDLVMQLKGTMDQGLLGDPVKVHITHHGPFIFADAPWLWNEKRSKYLLWEFGIHFIDMLVHLLGAPERVVNVLPFQHPTMGHTTDLEVSVAFKSGAIGRLEITADSTRHSTSMTTVQVYGSGMDAYVRWFPPLMRISSGQLLPMQAIGSELKAAWTIAYKLARGTFIRDRNISHYRTIDAYVDWLRDRSAYPMRLEDALPTLRLLEEIEKRIPSYASAGNGVDGAHATPSDACAP